MKPLSWMRRFERRLDRFVLALARLTRARSGYGEARGVMRIFRLVDAIMERQIRPQRLRPGGILRYEVAPLPARPLPLPGQSPVKRGERVVILHWDNRAIARYAAEASGTQALTWRLARAGVADFAALAELARSDAIPADVRAIWAETIVYTSLARYGFATRPAPRTLRTPFARLFQLSMMAIYGRDGLTRLDDDHELHLQLGEAWIGLDELRRRYGEVIGSR